MRLLSEDRPFLDGSARFTADLGAAASRDVAVVRFVRSSVAHAVLRGIDGSGAVAQPGVIAVLSADDLGVDPYRFFPQLHAGFARPLLATGRVRYVGDPLAMVVATSATAAADAVEAIVVELDPLTPVIDPTAALDAAPLFDAVGTNEVLRTVQPAATDPLAGADVVIRRRSANPRLSPLPLETSAVVVRVDHEGYALDVWASCQGVHAVRSDLAAALGLDPATIRVRAPSVGGGFGARYRPPLEYLAVAAAARRLGRDLCWVEDRTEQLISQPHGRGHHLEVALGVTAEGRFTGLVVRGVAEAGAYPHQAPVLVEYTRKMGPGPYRMAAVDFDVVTVVTNTAPVGAYRGAGQPEIVTAVELAIDDAARALALDPVELRRRNLLAPHELPHTTVTGVTYDSGDFPAALAQLVERLELPRWRGEQQRRLAAGDPCRIGIGVCTYAQITAVGQLSMRGQVRIDPDGGVTAGAGSHSHGQGHRSTFAALIGGRLGIEAERVRWLDADTEAVTVGHGTGGSRSAALAGSAVVAATDALLDRARALAAEHLEADPADIVVASGGLAVAGVPVSLVTWSQLADRAGPDGLAVVLDADPASSNTPYGAHGCVAEVDTDTGAVTVLAYVALDDCGTRLAPMLVEGQQHGGVVAGLAQALGEQIVYDDAGNPLTTTLVDYFVPAASELVAIDAGGPQVAATTNAVGVRGIGENGAIAATPALVNAVADALGRSGVELPLTPERVWRFAAEVR